MRSGDIIKVSVDSKPFINHFGIVVRNLKNEVTILHNTPDAKGLTETKLHDFLVTRSNPKFSATILSKETDEYIYSKYNNIKERDFNIFTNNCEHFTDKMTGEKVVSEQMYIYISIILISIITVFIFIQSKK